MIRYKLKELKNALSVNDSICYGFIARITNVPSRNWITLLFSGIYDIFWWDWEIVYNKVKCIPPRINPSLALLPMIALSSKTLTLYQELNGFASLVINAALMEHKDQTFSMQDCPLRLFMSLVFR